MNNLSNKNLNFFDKVTKPKYNKNNLKAGIVHFGVGNFHRSHQAVYLDELLSLNEDLNWGIIGAGILKSDDLMRDILIKQDYLTTVVEQEADFTNVRIISSMIDFVTISTNEGREKLIKYLTSEEIKIVSLTITEGGYFINPSNQLFDNKNSKILDDINNPDYPKTVFGLIIQALKIRRKNNIKPFTILSCDNISENGKITSKVVIGLAKLIDETLANWIKQNVSFPNSMVDRITPTTTDREINILETEFNIKDNWPVFCEGFKQWIIEDNFVNDYPKLEKVGVLFTNKVKLYELMKIRILNGGHAAIAYPSALLDINFVHEAMENDLIKTYLKKLTKDEIIPVVNEVETITLEDYRLLTEKRFSNPKIFDSTQRLCFDGSNRQPKFILPTVNERLLKNLNIKGLALASAFWCRYCYGITESGKIVKPNDENWERLNKQAILAKENPKEWLNMKDIFGDLTNNQIYVKSFSNSLNKIWQLGVKSTLKMYLDNEE